MKSYTITCQQQSVHITEWGNEQLPTIVLLPWTRQYESQLHRNR